MYSPQDFGYIDTTKQSTLSEVPTIPKNGKSQYISSMLEDAEEAPFYQATNAALRNCPISPGWQAAKKVKSQQDLDGDVVSLTKEKRDQT